MKKWVRVYESIYALEAHQTRGYAVKIYLYSLSSPKKWLRTYAGKIYSPKFTEKVATRLVF